MRTIIATLVLALAATATAAPPPPAKKISVVTTLNVLAGVARDIGGDRVTVTALAKPNQDPHTLVAKPTFKVAAKNASLFVEIGLGLDIWASAITDASGNPDIQTGQKGRVIASEGISTKELPTTLSKAWGDIHPYGNPHVWLDPVNVKQIASNIAAGLTRVDPDGKDVYAANSKAFGAKIDDALYGHALVEEYGASKLERLSRRNELIDYLKTKGTYDKLGGWLKQAEPLRGLKVITYHKTWIYFCDRFGLEIRGEVEEKPGIPPSQDYLATLIKKVQADGIKVLFIDTIYPAKDGEYIAGKTTAKIVSSPIDIGGAPNTDNYFALIGTLLERIIVAAK
ncbi:MAG: zinc/manganese transport system substrate-binding protein/zinc transport system substrate-binding [Deltaproteobacteria bacterium]|nr:zinc/manganese transport system substrate-binding protein/zinc transport system substrate-binding [Deltaproteobacteria bacterium]